MAVTNAIEKEIQEREAEKAKALGYGKLQKFTKQVSEMEDVWTTPDLGREEKEEARELFFEVTDWISNTGNLRRVKDILKISHQSIWKWKNHKEPISKVGLQLLRNAAAEIHLIERQRRQQEALEIKKIIGTRTMKIVAELLADCVAKRKKGMVMVNGESGHGKTVALREAIRNGDYEPFQPGIPTTEGKTPFVLLVANKFISPPEMVRKICRKLGVKAGSNTANRIEAISEFLKENPVLIVIDESDWWQRYDWLNALRVIWQGSQAPIFLLGCPRFMNDLMRPEDQWRQLNARIAVKYRFKALTFKEVLPFFRDYGEEKWSTETKEEIYGLSGANLHDMLTMMDNVKNVAEINPKVTVTPDFVRAVKKQFLS